MTSLPDTSSLGDSHHWLADLQKKCEEANRRRAEFRARHPRWPDESPTAYLCRLMGIRLREQFAPAQQELFGDYEPGGIYDYQH